MCEQSRLVEVVGSLVRFKGISSGSGLSALLCKTRAVRQSSAYMIIIYDLAECARRMAACNKIEEALH